MLLFFHLLTLCSSFEAGGCCTSRNRPHLLEFLCHGIALIFMCTYKPNSCFVQETKPKPKHSKHSQNTEQLVIYLTHNQKFLLTSCKEKAYEALATQ